jgi:WD40 repeat protein
MHVFAAGRSVGRVRFLPDGRLLVATHPEPDATEIHVWAVPGSDRVRLHVPPQATVSALAVHPTGEQCYVATGHHLYAYRTDDGTPLPVPDEVPATQVVVSSDGSRLLTADERWGGRQLTALAVEPSGVRKLWQRPLGTKVRSLAGFLADGSRFIAIEDTIQTHSFDADDGQPLVRYPTHHAYQPALSATGRHLGVIGYSSMYFYDLSAGGSLRRIGGSANFGNFVSFAFHPDERTVAVIHGGPTLVKVYDLDTLKLRQKYTWKLGPLTSVAFSADGTLGAAGCQDGRVVVWDVDA